MRFRARFVLLVLSLVVLAACSAPFDHQAASVSPTTGAASDSPSTAPSALPSIAATEQPSPSTISTAPAEAPAVTATANAAATTQVFVPISKPGAPTPQSPTATPVPSDLAAPSGAAAGAGSFARGTITTRPWAVMIDNQADAWPLSGVNNASLVFEALAEGGITRLMAVFADGAHPDLDEIGPVRSIRVYFVQWAMGLQAVLMHAGGSPDGLSLARSTDRIVNAEALALPQYTRRDDRRAAPHNLYASSALLRAYSAKAGPAVLDGQLGYLFEQIQAEPAPQATVINYTFGDPSYRAGWRYDAATNGYYRFQRDEPQADRVTGEQLWTRNVVVIEATNTLRLGDDRGRIDVQSVGSGAARVFLAGRQIEATWQKADAAAPLRFVDAQGQEIVFNAGPMWIAAVPSLGNLAVQ